MNFLTFDIEDYHHLLDISGLSEQYDERKSIIEKETMNILNMLEKHNKKAIFFVLGEVAERFPELINLIAEKGHVLGSHSHSHILHKDMTDTEFTQDLIKSCKAIEKVCGKKVICYRAPGFSMQEDFYHRYEIIRKAGIIYDFSLFQGSASHGGVDIKEVNVINFDTKFGSVKSFPFLKSNIFGLSLPLFGGGYFRLAPLFFLKSALKKNKNIMTYFHPRDFCNLQPRLKGLSLIRYFKAYYGLAGASKKLEYVVRSNNWSGINLIKGEKIERNY